MARIKVQKPTIIAETSNDDIFAIACLVCLHYPIYTPDELMDMSIKRLKNMLKVAEKQEAVRYANLVNIVAAPHTANPRQAISTLLNNYKEMASG